MSLLDRWLHEGWLRPVDHALADTLRRLRPDTPEPVIAKLNAALKAALATDTLKKRFDELASYPPGPDELEPAFVAKLVPGEIEKYKVLLSAK